jgi:hypothetical protein
MLSLEGSSLILDLLPEVQLVAVLVLERPPVRRALVLLNTLSSL